MSEQFLKFFRKYDIPVALKYNDPHDENKGALFEVDVCPCCSLPGQFHMQAQKKLYYCGGKNGIPWATARNMWRHNGKDGFLSVDSILDANEPEWLIQDHLPKKQLTVIYGPPETCKSFFELDRLMSVAYGVAYLDLDELDTTQGKCIYFYAEGGSDGSGLKRRVAAWLKHHNISREDPRKHNIMFSSYRYDLSLEQQIDKLVDRVNSVGKIDVLALDTLAKHFNGKENEDMTLMVNAACDIQSALDCAVDIIHHTGKDITRGERGGSQLRGGVDNSIELEGHTGEQENKIETITVTPRKRKDGRKIKPYQMQLLEVDLSERRHDRSIVLVPTGKDPVSDEQTKKQNNYSIELSRFCSLVGPNWIATNVQRARCEKSGISKHKFPTLLELAVDEGIIERMDDPSHKQRKLIRHRQDSTP